MLIGIRGDYLVFKDLTEDQAKEIENDFKVTFKRKLDSFHYLEGSKEFLFDTMYKLSFTYDIELV